MERIKMNIKRWGHSFGIVIPMRLIKKERIKDGSEIEVIIQPKQKTKVKDIFGILKIKQDTSKLMKDVDKELWPEED